MKVYVVVVNYHPANAPQNYETDCQIFLDKKQQRSIKRLRKKSFLLDGEESIIIVN